MTRPRDIDPGFCIGRGGLGEGCGWVGGVSGDTCPECGGMVLTKAHIDEAEALARRMREWDCSTHPKGPVTP